MNVYFISGLGVDRRAFQRIVLPDGHAIHHLGWLKPGDAETLEAYALGMARAIDTSKPFILVGLSFGGMVCSEIAKTYPPQKIILLSSASTRRELPWLYRAGGQLGVHRLLPYRWFLRQHWLGHWVFGARSPEEKILLDKIMDDTDPGFVRWAVNQIVHWQNQQEPVRLTRIHGTRDHVLFPSSAKPDHWVKGAGHLMVFSHADQVNALLEPALTTYSASTSRE